MNKRKEDERYNYDYTGMIGGVGWKVGGDEGNGTESRLR